MQKVAGNIHSFETFGSVDGPGVRFIIFLQGCQMRCQFCHNPDTWKMDENHKYTTEEVLERALRYKAYWKNDGGITVSGGEPLLQIDFVLDLFQKAKKLGIHTVIDTCGSPFTREEPFFSKFQQLMEVCDLLLVDIKHIDAKGHQELTGCKNENILDMLQYLSSIDQPIWIRHVLVPTKNDDEDSLKRLATFISSLKNVKRVELLPYHRLGVYKWKELGYSYPLEDVQEPTKQQILFAKKMLHIEE